jgi:hypothetical protein
MRFHARRLRHPSHLLRTHDQRRRRPAQRRKRRLQRPAQRRNRRLRRPGQRRNRRRRRFIGSGSRRHSCGCRVVRGPEIRLPRNGPSGRRRLVPAGQILSGGPRVCGTICRLCHNIRQTATSERSSQAFPNSPPKPSTRRNLEPAPQTDRHAAGQHNPGRSQSNGPDNGRLRTRGHGFGRHPRSVSVCCTMTGARPPRFGQPSCRYPSSCPTSWLIT